MAIGGLYRDLRKIFTHRPIQLAAAVYGVFAVALLAGALATVPPLTIAVIFLAAIAIVPPAEFLIHRYILHPLIWINTRPTARFWIRVHYAHHNHPSQEDVILSNPLSIAALVLALVIPASLIAPGTALAWAFAFIVMLLIYEVVHFSNHLPIDYENKFLRDRRRTHALHHYHNENINFGICWTIIDRLVGTYADTAAEAERSATVRNLGYDEDLAQKKPLVRIEYEKRQPQA